MDNLTPPSINQNCNYQKNLPNVSIADYGVCSRVRGGAGPLSHFLHVLGHRTLLVGRKM